MFLAEHSGQLNVDLLGRSLGECHWYHTTNHKRSYFGGGWDENAIGLKVTSTGLLTLHILTCEL